MSEKLQLDKSEWRPVTFGDVVKEVRQSTKDPVADGIERVVGLEHIEPECIHLRDWASIEDATTFTKTFRKGHVLFGRRRAYLKKAAIAEFDGICSGDITVMEAKEDFLPKLLPFLINNDKFFDYAVQHSAGGLSPRTKFKDLANYEFLLPPKDQQAKLAELLWAADAAVEKTSAQLDPLTLLRRSLLKKIIADTDVEVTRLEHFLSDILAGKSVMGRNEPASDGEYGVLKVSAVGEPDFLPHENKTLNDPSHFVPRFSVRRGQFLISRCNTTELVGRVCLVEEDHPNLMLCDKTIQLVLKEEEILPEFLCELLRSKILRAQIEARATGTGGAMKNISQEDIRSLKIPAYPITAQKEFLQELIRVKKCIQGTVVTRRNVHGTLKSLINQIF